jgi:hypothetical protein
MTDDTSPDPLRKIAEAATQILSAIRAGTHPHGDIRDAGRVLTGKWDQDFPTALLALASGQASLLSDTARMREDEGVLAEALERSLRDAGISDLLHVSMVNIIGRHMSHHIKDVAEEFRARAALESTHG